MCQRTFPRHALSRNYIPERFIMLTGSCLCTVNKYTITNEDAAVFRKVKNSYFRTIVGEIPFFIYLFGLLIDNMPLCSLPQD